ncbi:MAG: DUF2179 domain-containing protein [Ruminococcus sp.]
MTAAPPPAYGDRLSPQGAGNDSGGDFQADLPRLNNLVMDEDPEAFMIINQINEVRGRAYLKRVYKEARQ